MLSSPFPLYNPYLLPYTDLSLSFSLLNANLFRTSPLLSLTTALNHATTHSSAASSSPHSSSSTPSPSSSSVSSPSSTISPKSSPFSLFAPLPSSVQLITAPSFTTFSSSSSLFNNKTKPGPIRKVSQKRKNRSEKGRFAPINPKPFSSSSSSSSSNIDLVSSVSHSTNRQEPDVASLLLQLSKISDQEDLSSLLMLDEKKSHTMSLRPTPQPSKRFQALENNESDSETSSSSSSSPSSPTSDDSSTSTAGPWWFSRDGPSKLERRVFKDKVSDWDQYVPSLFFLSMFFFCPSLVIFPFCFLLFAL
jgi:hypothetical protein